MLKETGYIVAVEPDAVWVETLQQSTCGSCSARKGCGQRLLAKAGQQSMQLRVLLNASDQRVYQIHDSVTIAIPEHVIVKHSLFVYFLPIFLMIVFSGIAHTFFLSELPSILAGILGLALGALCIHFHACVYKNDPELQPIITDEQDSIINPQIIDVT